MTVETPLLIGGEERRPRETFEVREPHDGSLIGHAASATEQDCLDAVAAAHEAWPRWSALSAAERASVCLSAISGLDADFAERSEILSRENGKILLEAQGDSFMLGVQFQQAAALAAVVDDVETIPGPPFNTRIEHVSRGVVTIIYPFNWPLAILGMSLPQALISGNTVVVKPPPTAPLSSVMTLRHIAAALPPGVVNVITGADAVVGPIVVGDPRVKHVVFTGSVPGGARIMQMAASNITNVTLELGGNDPALVLDDCTVDEAMIARIGDAAWSTSGQICMALKRLYVPMSKYDEIVDGLRSWLATQKVGHGLDPDATQGPLNTDRQRQIVAKMLEESRSRGTEVIEGGEFVGDADPATGNYLLPSIVLRPAADEPVVVNEQFGPTLPVIPYDSESDAIARANDTWAGLTSSVWSDDPDHALSVGRRLRAGITTFNDHNGQATDLRAPFGGFNQSGIGRALGREGILDFTETHVLSVPDGSTGEE